MFFLPHASSATSSSDRPDAALDRLLPGHDALQWLRQMKRERGASELRTHVWMSAPSSRTEPDDGSRIPTR